MTAAPIEITDAQAGAAIIEQLDEDWSVPCEAGLACEKKRDAEWVIHFTACCPNAPKTSLWCTGCKDHLVAARRIVCACCGVRWIPGRTAIRLIEPLNRRST